MDWLLVTKAVAAAVLPPGGIVLLLGLSLLLWARRPRVAFALLLGATAGLYALSVGPVAGALIETVENEPALTPGDPRLRDAEAIVVLGGGRRMHAPEYGAATVSRYTLERLRYGAGLQRHTGLPIAVTGGVVFGEGPAEAELMAQVLRDVFGAPVRWIEPRSRNTEENAQFTAALLSRDGVRRIVLVSHAAHLRRAVLMFRDQGLEVVPAPTAWLSGGARDSPLSWMPSAGALARSNLALHELLGLLWYRLHR